MGDFSLGRDLSLDIVDPDVGLLRFPIRTGFDPKPLYHEIDSTALDAIHRHEDIPAGWQGTLELDRKDNSVDAYFARQEANFYAGLRQARLTITETINEQDGSVSQYRYEGVKIKLEDAGGWRGNDKRVMRIGFNAERKINLSA